MNGYTPTTERIRNGYVHSSADPERAANEFDAWLRPLYRDRDTLAEIRRLLDRDEGNDGQAVLP